MNANVSPSRRQLLAGAGEILYGVPVVTLTPLMVSDVER